jgi:hypothetical protein
MEVAEEKQTFNFGETTQDSQYTGFSAEALYNTSAFRRWPYRINGPWPMQDPFALPPVGYERYLGLPPVAYERSMGLPRMHSIAVPFKLPTTQILFFSALIYVAFRTPNPDEGTLEDGKKALKENGLDFTRLVKWENKQCQYNEFA